jgi:AcrR family transcriptional regulator
MLDNTLNRTERRKQHTRQRIKQAALTLLNQHGYDTLAVHTIMDYADLGRGTFYTHFQDKDALIQEILHDSFKHYREEIEADIPDCPCGTDNARCLWLRIFKRAYEHSHLYRIVLQTNNAAAVRQWVQTYLSGVIADHLDVLLDVRKAEISPDYAVQFLMDYCKQG